jgi:sarcosine oxidase subunit beta
MERADGKITRVLTTREPIDAGAVIDAAGPWSAHIAEMAGVSLPVVPLRRQVAATTPTTLLPPDMPMTIFTGDGFHFRVRDGRILLLYPTPGVPGRPFDASVEPEWLRMVAAIARERIRGFDAAEIDPTASHAGLYEISPDRHAILGPAPECENLWLINGSSGHGVMHSPALGQLLAEMMVDGRTSVDVSALSPMRFARQQLNVSSELL